MSKDIIVLTPNGRRQKVHVTPDTTMLQVLEDACEKHGFEATEYNLKHHNNILDLTTTVRFSNLPNKATLEMVEAERRRMETNVTVGLILEDGERRTADFPPNTSLFDLVTSLAPSEMKSLRNPMIMYMRQEVAGVHALREKTLRQLGLLGGRAILRLLNKPEESRQANVSSVYRNPASEKPNEPTMSKNYESPKPKVESNMAGPSTNVGTHDNPDEYIKPIDPLKLIQEVKKEMQNEKEAKNNNISKSENIDIKPNQMPMEIDESKPITPQPTSTTSTFNQQDLERRLKIEEECTFLGAQKAIAFMKPESADDDLNDLPDDFYELTIEEVRKLYNELQQQRMELENMPLLTSETRQSVSKESSQQRYAGYKNVVVRIQFPDNIILQGIFQPTNTIGDVQNFIREHLKDPHKAFHIFTTPLKEILDSNKTLLDAKFVPCVHMHFKWSNDEGTNSEQHYLKDEIYLKKTSSDAASILASKYRAPSRRKLHDELSSDSSQRSTVASSSKSSKLPKWLKR